jgi:CCR4-NOT transcriptional regulation complex NOT5 subunit
MPRDSLQIFAADELYKRKWKFNSENSLWFHKIESQDVITNTTTESEDNYEYFHPYDWKVTRYVFGNVNISKFVPDNDIIKYRNMLNY